MEAKALVIAGLLSVLPAAAAGQTKVKENTMGMSLKEFKASHVSQFGNLIFHSHAIARCYRGGTLMARRPGGSDDPDVILCDMPGHDLTLAGYKVKHWTADFYKDRLYRITYDNFDVNGYPDIERSLDQQYGPGRAQSSQSYDIPDDLSIPPSDDYLQQTSWETPDLLVSLNEFTSTPIEAHPWTTMTVELTFLYRPILEQRNRTRKPAPTKPL